MLYLYMMRGADCSLIVMYLQAVSDIEHETFTVSYYLQNLESSSPNHPRRVPRAPFDIGRLLIVSVLRDGRL